MGLPGTDKVISNSCYKFWIRATLPLEQILMKTAYWEEIGIGTSRHMMHMTNDSHHREWVVATSLSKQRSEILKGIFIKDPHRIDQDSYSYCHSTLLKTYLSRSSARVPMPSVQETRATILMGSYFIGRVSGHGKEEKGHRFLFAKGSQSWRTEKRVPRFHSCPPARD